MRSRVWGRWILAGGVGCALVAMGVAAQAAQPPAPSPAAEPQETSTSDEPTSTTERETSTTRGEATSTTAKKTTSTRRGRRLVPRRTARSPGLTSTLVAARDPGTRLPSPWALAGFIPVAVLVTSAAYSAWWRRRRTVPA